MDKFKSLFQYASDLHIEKGFKRFIKPSKPYLILAGDIGYPSDIEYKNFLLDTSKFFDKVFVISGNHEYDLCKNDYNEVDNTIEDICYSKNNLFYLQKKTYKICDEDNLYLTGCTFWSALPKSKFNLHLEHKLWLENVLHNENNKYIVATHHCPLFQCINSSFQSLVPNYFATDQTELIKLDNLLTWIHGHSHINKDFNIYGKWIISNQYGSYKNYMKNYKIDF
jgi:predicted phosphodiesterase